MMPMKLCRRNWKKAMRGWSHGRPPLGSARLGRRRRLPRAVCAGQVGRGRRALLRAELDAYYARLYGLTRDELRYILDPKDVYGPDFPGETFRVLKEKEERAFGEYRTRRLVLEAWDRLEEELGPVVVRNYREEMNGGQETGDRGQETGAGVRKGPSIRRPFNLPRLHAASSARSGACTGRQTCSRSAGGTRTGCRPACPVRRARRAGPQPVKAKSAPPAGARRPAPGRARHAPPQGAYPERLARVMALRNKADSRGHRQPRRRARRPDAKIRWLAALTLQEHRRGDGDRDAARVCRGRRRRRWRVEEAEKLLGKLTERMTLELLCGLLVLREDAIHEDSNVGLSNWVNRWRVRWGVSPDDAAHQLGNTEIKNRFDSYPAVSELLASPANRIRAAQALRSQKCWALIGRFYSPRLTYFLRHTEAATQAVSDSGARLSQEHLNEAAARVSTALCWRPSG